MAQGAGGPPGHCQSWGRLANPGARERPQHVPPSAQVAEALGTETRRPGRHRSFLKGLRDVGRALTASAVTALLLSCVTLGESLGLSELQFPHLHNTDSNSYRG